MADQGYMLASDTETNGEEMSTTSFPEIAIGIDMGTSQSRVAIWNGSQIELLQNCRNQKTMRSYVTFKDDIPTTGVSNHLSSEQEFLSGSTIFNVKRLIGRLDTDPVVHSSKNLPFLVQTLNIGVRPIIAALVRNIWTSTTPEEVLAIFLVELRAMVEIQLKRQIKNVVITIPVSFNRFQLSRIERACAMAGLHILRLMPEPTAVALLYAQYQQQLGNDIMGSESEKIALIFNMGAGYCDVAVSATAGGVSQIKALTGSAVGGEDILQNMMQYLYPDANLFLSRALNDIRSLAILRVATQDAIHLLSFETSVQVNVDIEYEKTINKLVYREEFEEVNTKVFENCKTLVSQCLKDAKVNVEDLDDVILVGGCSIIPKIRNIVTGICKREEMRTNGMNLLEAAVCGAALEGALASGISDPMGNLDLLTIQATPFSLGIRADGNIFFPIIPKNTTTPARKELIFTTGHDCQTEALIVVYEGEGIKVEENYLLGYFKIVGIPSAPKGVAEVTVCMDIDASNVLKVLAGAVMPKSQQRPLAFIMEVRMPTVDDGHGWCLEALHNVYGSRLDLVSSKNKV